MITPRKIYWKGRLSTINLHIKVSCIEKKYNFLLPSTRKPSVPSFPAQSVFPHWAPPKILMIVKWKQWQGQGTLTEEEGWLPLTSSLGSSFCKEIEKVYLTKRIRSSFASTRRPIVQSLPISQYSLVWVFQTFNDYKIEAMARPRLTEEEGWVPLTT